MKPRFFQTFYKTFIPLFVKGRAEFCLSQQERPPIFFFLSSYSEKLWHRRPRLLTLQDKCPV
ncbi:MAG: hypothetical protein A2Z73_01635 [Deltaproteobacteria bacterium RBG_13_60_28]|nr:MAG: hypothetical protein A2Z73_01635 [Deltaproteobacteria bacterium RBG_13_60_28]